MGILIEIVAWIWKGSPALGLVIGLALALSTILAASLGEVVPLLLERVGQDPAVANGPFLATIKSWIWRGSSLFWVLQPS